MLVSRFGVFRNILTQLNRPTANPASISLRNGHAWSYRTAAPPAPKYIQYLAEGVGAFMWWWILWHLWHEYTHITGEFDYPDVSKWTDEELGIPPDDEE